MKRTTELTSCDTLVALGNSTADGSTIFAKNSDRSDDEIMLIRFYPSRVFEEGEQLKCTYISIPQVRRTYSCILSQPSWMFGAEMGSNEHGVSIGNEAVWTKEEEKSSGLLGMDLLRLGLERGSTATEALNVIIGLLEKHGQGGNCAEGFPFNYHNSFLICDVAEAYILETAGIFWCYEKVKDVRSISNNLSIMGKGDRIRDGTVEYAISKKYCSSEENFNFAVCFSSSWSGPDTRELATGNFLKKNKGKITPLLMTNILRNHRDGICMHGGFESTGSQISSLHRNYIANFFTVSSCTCKNIFHPFAFVDGNRQNGITMNKPSELEDCIWTRCKKNQKNISEVNIGNMRKIEEENMNLAMEYFIKKDEKSVIDLHNKSINQFKEIIGIN